MSITCFFDHNVPFAIVAQIRGQSIDVITAFEDGKRDWDDERLLIHAHQLQRCFVTQDLDFLEIAARWQRESREFSGVVFIRHQQLSIGDVVSDLKLISEICTWDEMANRVHYLPL